MNDNKIKYEMMDKKNSDPHTFFPAKSIGLSFIYPFKSDIPMTGIIFHRV
jgi:hypothetical protein